MLFVFGYEGYLWAVRATITEKKVCGEMDLEPEILEVRLDEVVRENVEMNNLAHAYREALKDKVRALYKTRR